MTVIAVLSMKGGVGKSTVALGLASAAWQRDLRCLVIDLDPMANSTMVLGADDAEFTANDVLADARPGVAADAVVHSGWGRRIDLIAGERGLEHRTITDGRASAQRLRTALATLPRAYDIVVIDCPPSLGELTQNALHAADRAVVVTEPSPFALHGAREAVTAVDVVTEANPRLRVCAVVVNRLRPDDREHRVVAAEVAAAFGPLVFDPPLPDCAGVPAAQRAASPLHAWNAPGTRALCEAFDDLLDAALGEPPRAADGSRAGFIP